MPTIAPERDPERDANLEAGSDIVVLLAGRSRSGSLAGIVRSFHTALPAARILVFADGSGDPTALEAARAGAAVFRAGDGSLGEAEGSGASRRDDALRRMFADIDADIYLVADPATSDAADAPSLVNALVTEGADMAVGVASRAGPKGFAGLAFALAERLAPGPSRGIAAPLADTRSPYRALTRRFVKSLPVLGSGLPIEAEMSLHARQLGVATATLDVGLWEGSFAATMSQPGPADKAGGRSGLRLLREIVPLAPFAAAALLCWIGGVALTLPPLVRSPADAATPGGATPAFLFGLLLIVAGMLAAGCALVLDEIGRFRAEQKRVRFLALPSLDRRGRRPALRAVAVRDTPVS